MPHAPEKWLPALLVALILVSSLGAPAPADAQGPPPGAPCPRGYHWAGMRGCWPNRPDIPTLCPQEMAWSGGRCRPMRPAPVPPPPPPAACPRGYHWDGPRGCWPNRPDVPPLCPPHMAWSHGHCQPMGPGRTPPPAY